MGKIDAESSINHFSHSHPLKLISYHSATNKITCSSCTQQASGLVYICEPCGYCLHEPCSKIPRTMNHKVDEIHALTLLSSPAYTGGKFQCNACGVLGTGFCYHCAECQIDLHPACAFVRSTLKCTNVHDHPLNLYFEPPYEDKAFICDACGGSGSNHWLYRCDPCGFDAHLKCAKAPNCRPQMNQNPQSKQPRMLKSRSVHNPTSSWRQKDQCLQHIQQPQAGMPMIATELPYQFGSQSTRQLHRYDTAPVYSTTSFVHQQQQPTRNNAVQNIVNSTIEGLIEGAANQLGQILLQGALGN